MRCAVLISPESARRLYGKASIKFPGAKIRYVPLDVVVPEYMKRVKIPQLNRAIEHILEEGKTSPSLINKFLEDAGIEIEDRPPLTKLFEESAREKGIFRED